MISGTPNVIGIIIACTAGSGNLSIVSKTTQLVRTSDRLKIAKNLCSRIIYPRFNQAWPL